MTQTPVPYRNIVWDNARWEGFALRDGDIIISTPPKCGTTWTQMICALLIFQAPDLPRPLDQISPWLEMLVTRAEDVHELLSAQEHRRFIKSHTPLDGLPSHPGVTCITCGRDPRDVAISMDNHMLNMDISAFLRQRQEAVGLADLAEMAEQSPPAVGQSEQERFWNWVETGDVLGGLSATVHHAQTFWDRRDDPSVVMLHYDELRDDLDGQMRALAARLGIDVPGRTWPQLVEAASFDSMRSRAEQVAPNATDPIWRDTTRFFNRGTSGQWREVLTTPEDDKRYWSRVHELGEPDLIEWLHRGPA